MKKVMRFRILLLWLVMLILTTPCHATMIYDNFGPENTFNSTRWVVSNEEDIAASFIPTGSDFLLDYLELAACSFYGDPNSELHLSVVEDAGGLPGSFVLEALTLSDLSSSLSIRTLNASGSTLLTADNPYWLVASVEDDSWLGWGTSISDKGVAFKLVNSDWVYHGDPMQTPVFRIGGTPVTPSAPVPEPATIFLLGAGLAGLASTRIRRKKKE